MFQQVILAFAVLGVVINIIAFVIITKKKDKSEEAEEFVDENDILKNDDPFSNFLKEEMGMKTENEKQSNDDDNIGDDVKIDQRDESFEILAKMDKL